MERFVIVVCLLGTTLAAVSRPWPSNVVSRRGGVAGEEAAQDGNPLDVNTVVDQVKDTLKKATKGIDTKELEDDASKVIEAARLYLQEATTEVPLTDVRKVVHEVASKLNIQPGVAAFFDHPLKVTAEHLDIAFHLWQSLADKTLELQASGQSPRPAVAGLRLIAHIIRRLAKHTESIVTYLEENSNEESVQARNLGALDVEKRGGFSLSGGLSWGPFNLGGGINITWGKRKRSMDAPEVEKRGHVSVSGHASISWGK